MWFTILTGVAAQVRLLPEVSRARLVKHASGKETIEVRNDALLQDKEAWADVFPVFASELKRLCVESDTTAAIIDTAFETKDPVATIAMQVAAMDVMSSYFEYVVRTRCGIPRVILQESQASWLKLAEAARKLDLPGLLDKLASEYGAEKPDAAWWSSLYKVRGGNTRLRRLQAACLV